MDDFRLYDYTLAASAVESIFDAAYISSPLYCPGDNVVEEVVSDQTNNEPMVFCRWDVVSPLLDPARTEKYTWDEVAAFPLPEPFPT